MKYMRDKVYISKETNLELESSIATLISYINKGDYKDAMRFANGGLKEYLKKAANEQSKSLGLKPRYKVKELYK
jgi:hypothetical protein